MCEVVVMSCNPSNLSFVERFTFTALNTIVVDQVVDYSAVLSISSFGKGVIG